MISNARARYFAKSRRVCETERLCDIPDRADSIQNHYVIMISARAARAREINANTVPGSTVVVTAVTRFVQRHDQVR